MNIFQSLKKLEKMLQDAEKAELRLKHKRYNRTERRLHHSNKNLSRSQSPDREKSPSDKGHSRRSRSPVDHSCNDKGHDRENYDMARDENKKDNDEKRYSKDHSSNSRSDRDQYSRSSENESKGDKYERRPESSRNRQFMKPDTTDRHTSETSRHRTGNERQFIRPKESESGSNSSRKTFMKPGDMAETSSRSRSGHDSNRDEQRWKRPGFRKPTDEGRDSQDKQRSRHRSRSPSE